MKLNNGKGYSNLFLLAFCIFLSGADCIGQSRTFGTPGLFNTRHADLSSRRVALNGKWDFYAGKLLLPSQLKEHKSTPLMVPALWNDENGLNNTGSGTYSLALILPGNGEKWALEIPQLYNSYNLYIDDSLYTSNGRPALSRDSSLLQWKPQVVTFVSSKDTTRIVLQLSNFHHFKGGIREPVFLGTASLIRTHFSLSLISVWVEVCFLLMLAMLFLYLYSKSRGGITLYFGLLCIAWAIRELFSDIYPISNLFPGINWFLLVRIEYGMLFLITIFAALFISELYREFSSDLFKYLMVVINVLFLIFVLVTPVIVFSRWLPLYLITTIATLVYAGILIVRAIVLEKNGAWYLTAALIVSLVAIGYDLIAYEAALSNHVFFGSICYIIIFVTCAIGLLQHLRIIRANGSNANTLRYQDLYRD